MPASTSSFRTSPYRCHQCSPPDRVSQKDSRNLIVCIDGTSNKFGQNNTNVVKLFAKIDLETTQPQQFAYYSSGIGTRPKSLDVFDSMKRAISDKFDLAIAWNVEEIVKDAYGWLARTYREGDKIYLFGFSRGAYQVRVLAGMIHEVGLIRTPTEKQIGTAYDHYESIRPGKPKAKPIAREFKNTFSWKGLRVHFVGVWDTVSSVGITRGDIFLSTSSSAAHACHFRHALALDERRVKFMPEYFHEMNSETDDVKLKYVDTPLDVHNSQRQRLERAVGGDDIEIMENTQDSKGVDPSFEIGPSSMPQRERRGSPVGSNSNESSSTRISKNAPPDIKEVWFAGSHSDVGGRNSPGNSAQAGNASLLWMRREAAGRGLKLLPTDVVWVPDDLDLGITDSMNLKWGLVEYLPIKHQVTFSGHGEDARRTHQLQPRRIIPGQKVHASVLYANVYKPQATLGKGFDIPITSVECDDADLGNPIWETGLFDDTAAQELVNSLSGQQGVAPIYLDRLLFMLRFNEGKQCVRNVLQWEDVFETLIESGNCAPLVRLVTIVAYYEASCEPRSQNPAQPRKVPSKGAFDDAKKCLFDILDKHKHRDGPRVVALLRPLTKHKDLREHILNRDILEKLVDLLDKIIERQEGNFGQAMDGLNSLLRCDDTRKFIISRLGENYPHSDMSRLSCILKVTRPGAWRYLKVFYLKRFRQETRFQVAALRMVLTLARIPEEGAKKVCSMVKSGIKDLTKEDNQLVGLLATEVWLALYDPREQGQDHLDLRNAHVRANLASALVNMNFGGIGASDGRNPGNDTGQQTLRRIFGVGAETLERRQKKYIEELKNSVQSGNARERIAATMTLLKLCDTPLIRQYLREIQLLDVFVKQLQKRGAALLAAYALAVCLNYTDMKESIKSNEHLPKYIVSMLQLDYFDDAIGQIEGFQVFGNIMRDADLRKRIKKYHLPEILERKLGKGKPNDIRTSLICLDIFRSFDVDGTDAHELVDKSLKHLRNPFWEIQKIGVTILSALAQTEYGAAAITPRVHAIVEMLLPNGYFPILRTVQESAPMTPPSSDESRITRGPAAGSELNTSPDTLNMPPSWMMGPACALRILAQNQKLRGRIRDTLQYGSLKHLYLSGMLVGKKDTPFWDVDTPNRTDVTRMLDKMIEAVDGELSEDGLMSFGDNMLPHIDHWDRLAKVLGYHAFFAVTFLPVSILAILGTAVATPVFLSYRAYGLLKQVWSRRQDTRFLSAVRGRYGVDVTEAEDEGNS